MTDDIGTDVDEERFTAVIKHGLEVHPQPELLDRLIAAGASLYARRNDNDEVEVQARFDDSAEELRHLRAEVRGEQPAPPATPDERATVLHIMSYPAWGLRAPGQG